MLNWIHDKDWFYDKGSLELNHPPPELWVFIFYTKLETNRIFHKFLVVNTNHFTSFYFDHIFWVTPWPPFYDSTHLLCIITTFLVTNHETEHFRKLRSSRLQTTVAGGVQPSRVMFIATQDYSPPMFNSEKWWPQDDPASFWGLTKAYDSWAMYLKLQECTTSGPKKYWNLKKRLHSWKRVVSSRFLLWKSRQQTKMYTSYK